MTTPDATPAPAPEITLWAPTAASVDVEFRLAEGPLRRAVMKPKGDGWWRWQAPPAPSASPEPASGPSAAPVPLTPGAGRGVTRRTTYPCLDYAFRIDGGEPTPDPRSPWQPEGVEGLSRWFDPTLHEWTDATWAGPQRGAGALGGVIYELHVGTFTPEGTLDSAQRRLGHLAELGVDVVQLMPLAARPGRWNWGYDGVSPWSVDDGYGGPAALQRFVDTCHGLGMGVCLDVVYNHLGPVGNHLARFGPYFTDAHPTPWGQGLNLDGEGSFHVRRWIIDNALRWFGDFHVDALRLDAVHELHDDSPRHVLAQLSDEVAQLATRLGRPLDLIAESDLNDPVTVAPTSAGGRGMTAQWDDDVHHALHVMLTRETQGYYADFAGRCRALPDGGPLAVVAKTLTRAFLHDGTWSSFRDRDWGAPVDVAHTDARRFLAYLQTHDQVGNRAKGERISDLVTPARQAVGAALYLTCGFTPMIFMGEEWGARTPFQFFTDFTDPEVGAAVTAGRLEEFAAHGWDPEVVPDPQDEQTFRRSQLDWAESHEPLHARMLQWYRDLITVRQREFAACDGPLDQLQVDFSESDHWLVLRRGQLRTVVNMSDSRWTVPLDEAPGELLLAWDAKQTKLRDQALYLPPWTAAVVRVGQPTGRS